MIIEHLIVPKTWPRMPIPTDDPFTLSGPQAIKAFFQKEMEIWDFIYKNAPPVPHRAEVRAGLDHMSVYYRIIEACNEIIADPESEDAEITIRGTIADRFGEEPMWQSFTSRDDVGKLILQIKELYGPLAAAFCVEYYYGDTTISATPDLNCLSGLALLGDPGLLSPALASQQLQECKSDIQKTIQYSNKTLNDLQTQKEIYAANIQSRAAVEYWEDKAREHTKNRNIRLFAISLYFVALISSMVAFYWIFFNTFEDKGASIPTTLYGIMFAGGASVIAALVWIGRFIMKLYISEHQMREDANERVVMTKTYLSLIEDNAVKNDSDRIVILTALFRPSPALMTDDGPPDVGFGAILGKFVSK